MASRLALDDGPAGIGNAYLRNADIGEHPDGFDRLGTACRLCRFSI